MDGKFFRRGSERLFLRGVTYGPFAPGADGQPYARAKAAADFAQIAAAGINTLRLYTPPPSWLLDLAAGAGLGVMAGLAWEQHVTFLTERRRADAIIKRVTGDVRAVAGHPALLGWAVGNEIPAPIVRWHGAPGVRAFLRRLVEATREADPTALLTYVNYPTTEYLELDFLDFVCFNVFLERVEPYVSYLHRLLNLVGDRPLVLTEIGLDSSRNGEEAQAETLEWQLREAFRAGCAGAFTFSWTDEWHRGGAEITDWSFGLTRRDRTPKPALTRVSEVFSQLPVSLPADPPRVSVLVCTYNGSATLGETCAALSALQYPNFEVVVVDDGSTDGSALIAEEHGFSVISTPNQGLSSARNTALAAATGEIVVYLDDDAMPDPHWLSYLVDGFLTEGYEAIGGPNLPVPGDGAVADAVSASPGNPIHVLLDDRRAEHIPGCNAAFRASALREIGGFDPRFRAAGDDVDVCWRLEDAGWRIGYCPAAVVWHHRRRTAVAYLRQQRGYGHAEAQLERKWPSRYTAGGHVSWRGRLYGESAPRHALGPLRWRIYHGVWGTAPFQSLYEPARGEMNALLLMPEIYLAVGLLGVLVALGAAWTPLLGLAPLLVVVAGTLAVRSIAHAARARFPTPGLSRRQVLERRALTAAFHVAQPLVRLEGRLRHGLSPWRGFHSAGHAMLRVHQREQWREEWTDPTAWLHEFERSLLDRGAVARRGLDFDRWDLEIRGGVLGGARVLTTVEEHGSGQQLFRLRSWPWASRSAMVLTVLLAALALLAGLDGSAIAAAVLGGLALLLAARTVTESSSALAHALSGLAESTSAPNPEPESLRP